MEPDGDMQFVSNTDFWISEIRGNIARLNDAASIVEIDIVVPARTNHSSAISDKIGKIRSFNIEFRRLYRNASQIIPVEMKEEIAKWFNVSESDLTNITVLKKGLSLSNELQDALFENGVKDIDIGGPFRFPYEYYHNMMVNEDGK